MEYLIDITPRLHHHATGKITVLGTTRYRITSEELGMPDWVPIIATSNPLWVPGAGEVSFDIKISDGDTRMVPIEEVAR